MVICDETIDTEAKSYNEETKTIPITFNNNKKAICNNILLDIKSSKNSWKCFYLWHFTKVLFMGAKPLHIGFNKIDGFIKIYDGTRYLVLFGHERYDAIFW